MKLVLKGSCLTTALFVLGCSSIPEPVHKNYGFPKANVFLDDPPEGRKFKVLGWVRAKEPFMTSNPDADVRTLCQNYYNKGAQSLLREAKKVGGDAIAQVRSVVFLLNGGIEEHRTAECSDDGGEGEILMKGVVIRWLDEVPSGKKPSK